MGPTLDAGMTLSQFIPKYITIQATKFMKMTIGLFLALALSAYDTLGDTNLDYEAAFTGPNVFWGSETNGVKLGLCISPASGANAASIVCTPILESIRPKILWLYLPPPDSRFDIALSDSADNPVCKTDEGKRLGSPLNAPFRLTTGMNIRAGYNGACHLFTRICQKIWIMRF